MGLGPALDSAAFRRVPERRGARHGAAHRRGADRGAAAPAPRCCSLDQDPLLRAVPGLAGGLGTEASVRGLDPALPLPLLSGVWLTTLPD